MDEEAVLLDIFENNDYEVSTLHKVNSLLIVCAAYLGDKMYQSSPIRSLS